MRKVLLPLLVMAALAAACGSQSQPSEDDGVPATTPSASTPPAASSTTAEPEGTVIAATVKGGEVTDAPDTAKVKLGEPVTIKVTADVADEVHVHGYDLAEAVKPGEPLTIDFVADIPGQFDVELESAHFKLFDFQVVE